MEEKKVKFRLESVINEQFNVWECVIHREGMEPMRVGLAKKDICLAAVVANTLACQFDGAILTEGESIEFELTMKINRK